MMITTFCSFINICYHHVLVALQKFSILNLVLIFFCLRVEFFASAHLFVNCTINRYQSPWEAWPQSQPDSMSMSGVYVGYQAIVLLGSLYNLCLFYEWSGRSECELLAYRAVVAQFFSIQFCANVFNNSIICIILAAKLFT